MTISYLLVGDLNLDDVAFKFVCFRIQVKGANFNVFSLVVENIVLAFLGNDST